MKHLHGLILMLCLVAPGAAADAPWLGVFVNEQPSRAHIDAAIETAVGKMNFIKRPIARSRLQSTNMPYARVAISRMAETISVALDDQPAIVTPASGEAIKWTRSDGEVFDVSGTIAAGSLVQTFKAEDGQRVNVFSADASGRLTLKATITSPQLSAPLNYQLQFARAKSTP